MTKTSGTIAGTAVADNAPPAVVGCTFRASRHNSAGFNYANSSGAAFKTVAGFFDTTDWISPDMTWDGTNLTVTLEGSYMIVLRYNCSNIPTGTKFNPIVFQQTAAQGAGATNVGAWLGGDFADAWTGNAPYGSAGVGILYCKPGDILTHGYASSGAGTLVGEASGDTCYFQAALLNRSLA
jgi:hypothetical protein